MLKQKKYTKAFYDDGLGDILEWIDDEILIHSKDKQANQPDANSSKRRNTQDDVHHEKKGTQKTVELYGDNDLNQIIEGKSTKRSRLVHFDKNYGDRIDVASEKVDKKLEDRVRGLLNRLAARTMPFVSSEFEKLYSSESRTLINIAIINNIESAIICKSCIAKRKIVAEVMLLISYLSVKISHNIGAFVVHHLVNKFEQLYSDGSGDAEKCQENIVLCLSTFYIIGLISANVIFEFCKRICSSEDFRDKTVELLLIATRNIGFQLRKDNPSHMQQLILMITQNCQILKENKKLNSRIEFMIEALNAIKNNNQAKISNYGSDIDRDIIETTLKRLVDRTKLPERLADATYDDIRNSANFHLLDTRVDEQEGNNASKLQIGIEPICSKKEQKICKALGLNKPAERTILSALLKVTDFNEASNIIIGFGMNHCSDAMIVCLHVAVHEKNYNPFYFNLLNNLCKFHRKYKIAAKYAMQDKIRNLSGTSNQRIAILKQLCFKLIETDAIPITVLKSIEWANLDSSTKEFLIYVLRSIGNLPEPERRKIMIKSDKRSTFAGAMRTFTRCFLKDCDLFQRD